MVQVEMEMEVLMENSLVPFLMLANLKLKPSICHSPKAESVCP